jgi:membrane associated rhomboid family serine protease
MIKDSAIASELKAHAQILAGCLAVIWGVSFMNWIFFQGALNEWGIIPRNWIGLRGLLFAPLLHGGIGHLIANTVPFVVLGWFVMLRGVNEFIEVTVFTMLVGGLGTWLVASSRSVHIGASGVVFGYLGFLLARGYFERSVAAIALSILAGFFYGGMIWGILPLQAFVSWQGHLFGFIGGVIAAKLMSGNGASVLD